jgi:1-acyl-sn-glycerol-3-phosphate acyltransferase
MVIRGVLVWLLIPLATFVTSLLAIVFLVILRGSARKAQVLPRTWARIILAASGVKVKVTGLENIDKGRPYIFAANHQSQFDIFAMQGFFDFDFRWLAKKELFQIPLFGRAMQLAGYISIALFSEFNHMPPLLASRAKDGTVSIPVAEDQKPSTGPIRIIRKIEALRDHDR